jgi:hypothetical protein
MGDSKIVNKVWRLLEDSTADHVFEGEILNLEAPVAYAKHLVRGMRIETDEGIRQARFEGSFQNSPVMNTDSLKIGDTIVVIGCEVKRKKWIETSPRIILRPNDRTILLARESVPMKWKGGWADWTKVFCYIVGVVLGVLGVISIFTIDYYQPLTVLLGLTSVFLIVMTDWVIDWYVRFSRRERVIHCNPKEWDTFVETIASRFPRFAQG